MTAPQPASPYTPQQALAIALVNAHAAYATDLDKSLPLSVAVLDALDHIGWRLIQQPRPPLIAPGVPPAVWLAIEVGDQPWIVGLVGLGSWRTELAAHLRQAADGVLHEGVVPPGVPELHGPGT